MRTILAIALVCAVASPGRGQAKTEATFGHPGWGGPAPQEEKCKPCKKHGWSKKKKILVGALTFGAGVAVAVLADRDPHHRHIELPKHDKD